MIKNLVNALQKRRLTIAVIIIAALLAMNNIYTTMGVSYFFDTLTVTTLNTPTGRGATYVVASANASDMEKAQADYICDGTADDVEIQTAINTLPSGGGLVRLTAGTFYINATINITTDGIALHGTNPGEWNNSESVSRGTQLLSTSALPALVVGTSNGTRVNTIDIEDIFFDGNILAPIGTYGIRLQNVVDIFLHKLVLRNYTIASIIADPSGNGDYIAGIYADKIIATKVQLIPATNNIATLWAVYFDQSWLGIVQIGLPSKTFAVQKDIKISNSWLDSLAVYAPSSAGNFSQFSGSNLVIEDANSGGAHSVIMSNVNSGRLNGITVTNTAITATSNTADVVLDSVNNFQLSDFTLQSTLTGGNASNRWGLRVLSSQKVGVSNGSIFNFGAVGIDIYDSSLVAVSNIVIQDVGQSTDDPKYGIRIFGNSVNNSLNNILISENTNNPCTSALFFGPYTKGNSFYGGYIDGFKYWTPIANFGVGNKVFANQGYTTENFGSANITNGNDMVTVLHGLAVTPKFVSVSSSSNETGWLTWAANMTSINITASTNVSSNRLIYWQATVGVGN